jgi:hypothetical protein
MAISTLEAVEALGLKLQSQRSTHIPGVRRGWPRLTRLSHVTDGRRTPWPYVKRGDGQVDRRLAVCRGS